MNFFLEKRIQKSTMETLLNISVGISLKLKKGESDLGIASSQLLANGEIVYSVW
jgi:hypothetical protein